MDYLITGKKGNGKTLLMTQRIIEEYIYRGLPVATNIDLHLEAVLPPQSRKPRVTRLPEKPSPADFEALGSGNDSYDESQNGAIVIDEVHTMLSARDWQGSDRVAFLTWLTHSRKKGWDVYLLAQDKSQIDRQVRTGLVEMHVVCRALDRIPIPFIGKFLRTLSSGLIKGNFPAMRVGSVYFGMDVNALRVGRWWSMGDKYFKAYDTRQDLRINTMAGACSMLTPWHLVGRYLPAKWWQRLRKALPYLVGLRPWPRPPRPIAPHLEPLLCIPPDERWALIRRDILAGAW